MSWGWLRGMGLCFGLVLVALGVGLFIRPASTYALSVTEFSRPIGRPYFVEWFYNPGGYGRLPVADTPYAQPYSASYSPDGRWRFFALEDPASSFRYWVVFRNLQTGRLIQVEVHDNGFPAVVWSPDGNAAVWELLTGGSLMPNMLMRRTHVVDLIEPSAAWHIPSTSVRTLWWQPDGSWIWQDWDADIYQARPDCSPETSTCALTQLLDLEDPIVVFAYTPDLETYYALSLSEAGDQQLRAVKLDRRTGARTTLVEQLLPGTVPAISPDGRWMAVGVVETSDDSTQGLLAKVVVVDVTSGEQRLVWLGIAGQLEWSPDGAWLAFELIDGVTQERSNWLYDSDTQAVSKVTPDGESFIAPRWRPLIRDARLEGGMLAALGLVMLLLSLWRRN